MQDEQKPMGDMPADGQPTTPAPEPEGEGEEGGDSAGGDQA